MQNPTVNLAKPPWEALLAEINHRYRLSLTRHTARLVMVEPLEHGHLEVIIAERWRGFWWKWLPPHTQYTFVIDRFDLTEWFGKEHGYWVSTHPDLPTDTLTLVHELSRREGVVFHRRDFQHEPIHEVDADGGYTLLAHPHSLRWYGQLRIQFSRQEVTVVAG